MGINGIIPISRGIPFQVKLHSQIGHEKEHDRTQKEDREKEKEKTTDAGNND